MNRKQNVVISLIVATLLLGASGCTVIGAGIGAVAGSGSTVGMVGGAVIGGVIGHQVGHHHDNEDKQ